MNEEDETKQVEGLKAVMRAAIEGAIRPGDVYGESMIERVQKALAARIAILSELIEHRS